MVEEIRKVLEDHERRISALEEHTKKKPQTNLPLKKSTEDLLVELKGEGFFNEDRPISQIREALHEKGRIVKITDLPPYLLKLVRNDTLKRTRKTIGKRKTWVYYA